VNDRPFVSVIIPNYNYSRSLPLCLRALAEQSYPRMEVIVVDDCSSDDSVEVARAHDVTVLSTERNSGCAGARNLGVRHAAGEIYFFLDSDVALDRDAVRNAVEALEGDPRIGAVCGVYEAEPLIRDSLVEECRSLQAHYWRCSSEGEVSFLFPSLCAMRATAFHDVGPFNPRLRETEEIDYGQRLTRAGYAVHLTAAVRGSHDDDHLLWPLLRKVFVRGRLRVPLYAGRRRFAQGFETAPRAWACASALLAVLTCLPAAVIGGFGWLVPPALFAVSLLCDAGMYRFVAGRRPRLLVSFVAVQFLFNLSVGAGIAIGVLQWTASAGFRSLYDTEPAGLAPAGEKGSR